MIVLRNFLQILLISTFTLMILSCSDSEDGANGNGDDSEPSIPVEVSTVETGTVAAYFAGTATLEAEEEALVVARAEGLVEQILVEEGDLITAGQVMARLDRDRLQKQLAQTTANLQKMEADYKRNKEMFDNSLISAEEYQRSLSDFEAQKAAHELARLELNYTDIRAPISGIVSERLIKIGNMLGMHEQVFRITDFSPLHAILHVPERESGKLAVGQSSRLVVDAYTDFEFTGSILRISPVVNASTGTVKVTVAVSDPSGRLKPGMFARVNIIYDVHDNTLVVPKQAVLLEDDESAVYVVRDSMTFRQLISTGYTNGSTIEVLEGLNLGDTVVTIGQGALKDSSKVEIIQSDTIASK